MLTCCPDKTRMVDVQADRERLTMLLFEQFNIAGLFMCEQSILSLYSVGKTTGTVVDLGHGKTGPPWQCHTSSLNTFSAFGS